MKGIHKSHEIYDDVLHLNGSEWNLAFDMRLRSKQNERRSKQSKRRTQRSFDKKICTFLI